MRRLAWLLLACGLGVFGCSDDSGGGTCTAGLKQCGTRCVDTKLDPSHCGGCTSACKSSELCTAGKCVLACGGGTVNCGGACADTLLDPKNCGACQTACKTDEVCSAGKCGLSCVGGAIKCGSRCVDRLLDAKNCGACDTACTAGEVCSAGKCGLSCVGGTKKCGAGCVDTTSDPANCGACKVACKSGQVCSTGKCGLSCLGGSTKCGTQCVDANVDPTNCGTCGTACKSGEVCSAGKCALACGGGTIKCGAKCADLATDPGNCGACGVACKNGAPCLLGTCRCGNGKLDAGEACDGSLLNGKTCQGLGFLGGELLCKDNCSGYSTSRCSWVIATVSGWGDTEGYGAATDSKGDIIVAGFFSKTAVLGGMSVTADSGSAADLYLAKVTPGGKTVWVRRYGGYHHDKAWDVALDSKDNIILTGYITSTATFGKTKLTAKGGNDVLVLKLNPSGSTVLWAKLMGGTSFEMGQDVAVDSKDNILVHGYFRGTATFGATTFTATGPTPTYYMDIFLAKLDSAGKVLWARQAGGGKSEYGYGVAVDKSDDVLITGQFRETATFGATTLTEAGYGGAYLAKLDSNGNWLWAKSLAGAATGSSADGWAVATDSQSNVLVSGYFSGTVTGGTASLTSAGNRDLFVAKLDKAGKWLWAKRGGGAGWDQANGVAVDSSDNVFISGNFEGTFVIPGNTLTVKGGDAALLAKLDKNGTWLWAKSAGPQKKTAPGEADAMNLVVDAAGDVYGVGMYSWYVAFGAASFWNPNYDLFLWKLNGDGK